ncbi:MAG TPA: DUF4321 domain-containing protein [Candidatus Polarisedimenticolia bacterium]|nr:DUF4321 domain-containing protein [Candidatus Polarisedimenticolia bacterium]
MARGGLQFWHLIVIVALAAMLGTTLGDILGKTFPEGAAGRFLSASVRVGTAEPWGLDLRVLELTFGAALRLSVLGALGAAAALVIFFRRL